MAFIKYLLLCFVKIEWKTKIKVLILVLTSLKNLTRMDKIKLVTCPNKLLSWPEVGLKLVSHEHDCEVKDQNVRHMQC